MRFVRNFFRIWNGEVWVSKRVLWVTDGGRGVPRRSETDLGRS